VSAPLRCAWCHDALGAAGLRCPGCHTALHPECAAEAGRCPTLGCAPPHPCPHVDRPLRPAARALLRAAAWLAHT